MMSEDCFEGIIESLLENVRGDVDGLLLESGERVAVPPHDTETVREYLHPGDPITIYGGWETTPSGTTIIVADVISLPSEEEIHFYHPHRHHHAPEEGHGHHEEEEHRKPHERILDEIRSMREYVTGRPPEEIADDVGPPHEQILTELSLMRQELDGLKQQLAAVGLDASLHEG